MADPRDTAALLLGGQKPSEQGPPPAADVGETSTLTGEDAPIDEFGTAADEVAIALGGEPSDAFRTALKSAIEICVAKSGYGSDD